MERRVVRERRVCLYTHPLIDVLKHPLQKGILFLKLPKPFTNKSWVTCRSSYVCCVRAATDVRNFDEGIRTDS